MPSLRGRAPDLVLSLGVIDGRNIWKADLNAILDRIEPVVASGDAVILAPSCSLLHMPIDLARESDLDPEVKGWLAFAVQKVAELAVLAKALNEGRASVRAPLDAASASVGSRRTSGKINDPAVKARTEAVDPSLARRPSAFEIRRQIQREKLHLPRYPTTTIGSFPQTAEIRKARAEHGKGAIDEAAYECSCARKPRVRCAGRKRLASTCWSMASSSATTWCSISASNCPASPSPSMRWVQSYGSRCVQPPIIYGDVSRPKPMTVDWWRYAQSLTEQADEGHADRAGHDPAMVFRARRPAAQRDLPPDRLRHPRRGRGSGKGRRADHPDRRGRAARGPAAAAMANGRLISTGRSSASASLAPACGTRRRSNPYVLFGVQRHHRRRSARWMPM